MGKLQQKLFRAGIELDASELMAITKAEAELAAEMRAREKQSAGLLVKELPGEQEQALDPDLLARKI